MDIQNQGETTTSPWGISPKVKHLVEALDMKIPLFGKLDHPRSANKNLERFRRAQNAAYDLFNNGLCNKRSSFKSIFGWAPYKSETDYASSVQWTHWEDKVEETLTPIIYEAAKEQGLVGGNNNA